MLACFLIVTMHGTEIVFVMCTHGDDHVTACIKVQQLLQ